MDLKSTKEMIGERYDFEKEYESGTLQPLRFAMNQLKTSKRNSIFCVIYTFKMIY